MSDADCTPGREPRCVAASYHLSTKREWVMRFRPDPTPFGRIYRAYADTRLSEYAYQIFEV